MTASHKMAEEMYKAAGASAGDGGAAPPEGGATEPPKDDGKKKDPGVVDAEFDRRISASDEFASGTRRSG